MCSKLLEVLSDDDRADLQHVAETGTCNPMQFCPPVFDPATESESDLGEREKRVLLSGLPDPDQLPEPETLPARKRHRCALLLYWYDAGFHEVMDPENELMQIDTIVLIELSRRLRSQYFASFGLPPFFLPPEDMLVTYAECAQSLLRVRLHGEMTQMCAIPFAQLCRAAVDAYIQQYQQSAATLIEKLSATQTEHPKSLSGRQKMEAVMGMQLHHYAQNGLG